MLRPSSPANAERGAHPCRARRVELGGHVGDEEYGARGVTERGGDLPVTGRFALWAGRRVEVTGQKEREVACRGISEEIVLRLDAARGKDRDRYSCVAPALECRAHVGVDFPFSLQLAPAIPGFPNTALERLQSRRFAITIHQPIDIGFGIPRRKIRVMR